MAVCCWWSTGRGFLLLVRGLLGTAVDPRRLSIILRLAMLRRDCVHEARTKTGVLIIVRPSIHPTRSVQSCRGRCMCVSCTVWRTNIHGAPIPWLLPCLPRAAFALLLFVFHFGIKGPALKFITVTYSQSPSSAIPVLSDDGRCVTSAQPYCQLRISVSQ